ncbi:MAG: hydrogenase expression/formation protein [Rubrivivax sp.]|nr:hydrogenase expression/formation protein [Rubrivivax sp.]
MKDFPVPVRAIGPGSQPEDDAELDFLPMPREMNSFAMPRVPEQADPAALAASRDVLASFLAALEAWDPKSATKGPRVDMIGTSPAALEITNQMLGEGEVSIQIKGERCWRIQESVFTGLWRCCEVDAEGRLLADWLEAGAVPEVALQAARAAAVTGLPAVEWPAGAMNSPALVAEIGSQLQTRNPAARAHVINLTLFPMTPDDHAVLERALPVGPVAMISRGFGNCHVTSTLTRDVWRVQYFNSMNTLILNTLEVVGVPEVALASAEDLADSRERLSELVQWMDESVAEQAQA